MAFTWNQNVASGASIDTTDILEVRTNVDVVDNKKCANYNASYYSTDNATVDSSDRVTVYSGQNTGYYATNNATVDSTDNTTVYSGQNTTYNGTVNSSVNSSNRTTVYSGQNSGYYTSHNIGVNATNNWTVDSADRATVYTGQNSGYNSGYNSSVRSGYNSTVYSGQNSSVNSAANSGVNSAYNSTVDAPDNTTVRSAYWGPYYSTYCFLSGTKILMADGSNKSIEDVRIGELVTSFDVQKGVTAPEAVTQTISHEDYADGYLIINNKLRVTHNHPMWVNNKNEWLEAGRIAVGDKLLNERAEEVIVDSVVESGGRMTVYNLHLEGPNNNYFSDGLLTHNKPI